MAHRNRVFISYSHRDIKYLQRLQVHLAQYAGEGLADYWDDTKIQTGVEWEREIFQAIDSARIAILLVSADFLASTYIMRKEVPRLLTAARDEGLVVVPVIISPCAFAESVLAPYQVVNGPHSMLSGMDRAKREGIWARIAELVARTLRDIPAEASPSAGKQETAKPAEAGAKTIGQQPGQALSDSASVERVRASRTIIVADDSNEIIEAIALLVSELFPAYSVVGASDGREVLKLIDSIVPALVILT